MNRIQELKKILKEVSSVSYQESVKRFFKTGPGDYAEHDRFLGIRMPQLRIIAKQFGDLNVEQLQEVVSSLFNEERALALLILVSQFQKGDEVAKEKIYHFYLSNTKSINNWNLVDISAHHIVGAHLLDKDKKKLVKLAQSKNMWERRIAMVSCWFFIRKGDLAFTFELANMLMNDIEDLMHKATGWMLREAGKKEEAALLEFLDCYAARMPRTMLRYAIERLSSEQRNYYLAVRIR